MKQRKIKIFIGLREVAGYFDNLNTGFNYIGIPSVFFKFYKNKYYDNGNLFMRFCQIISVYEHSKKIFGLLYMFNILVKLLVFVYVILFYNTFIFEARSAFFNYRELKFLKKTRKKIIYVFLGSDSRPDYLNGSLINQFYLKNGNVVNINECVKNVKNRKNTIRIIEKYADICINHPPCALFHEKPYIKWLYIGFPFSKNNFNVKKENISNFDKIKIVHAPSNPEIKGTYILKKIIENLKTKGANIEYIEIINQPNKKVLEVLSQCDFVIDELYSDIPLGGLGTEAAFFGKPVINGGYYSKFINSDYDESIIPPAIFSEPDKIEENIKNIISNKDFCKNLGNDVYNFVMNNWDAKAVAMKYLRLINNDISKEWIGDPYTINYVFGYGQSKEQLRKIINAIFEKKGKNGFALNDKPELLEKLLNI